jgi:hypothetical protein
MAVPESDTLDDESLGPVGGFAILCLGELR